MKAPFCIIILVLFFANLAPGNDATEIRSAATAASKALSERDWDSVYDGWSDRLKLSNSWEAFFEASFAIETNQQWKEQATALLSKVYNREEADEAIANARKKNPRISADEEMKIFMDHVTDWKALWISWTKVMTKDAEILPPHDFGKASVEFLDGFAKLSDGDIEMYFKKEDGEWKLTSKEIEPELQKTRVEQGGAGQPATRSEPK